MKSIGNRIKARREELKWSRADLASRLGCRRMKVWRMEKGTSKVKTDYLPKLARALRMKVTELIA